LVSQSGDETFRRKFYRDRMGANRRVLTDLQSVEGDRSSVRLLKVGKSEKLEAAEKKIRDFALRRKALNLMVSPAVSRLYSEAL